MSTPRVLIEVERPFAVLTINRPEAHNAMTLDMYNALVVACDRVDADPGVRVLTVRGAGGRAFSSGTDIAEFRSFRSGNDGLDYERRLEEVVDRVERMNAVTIAQVQGVATGGGCLIAMACDLRVCTPDARFGVPVARTLGNCLSAANAARVLELIGPSRLADLMLTARLMDAPEAAAAGLATRISAPSEIDAVVRELASAIATYAPLTIRATKEMIRRTLAARRAAIVEADDLVAACYGSADFREGVQAFLAKRPPRFTGS